MKFKIKQQVKIISRQKIDGRFNYGIIVGIEIFDKEYRIGVILNHKEYVNSCLTECKYKVQYFDCVGGGLYNEWFNESEIERKAANVK